MLKSFRVEIPDYSIKLPRKARYEAGRVRSACAELLRQLSEEEFEVTTLISRMKLAAAYILAAYAATVAAHQNGADISLSLEDLEEFLEDVAYEAEGFSWDVFCWLEGRTGQEKG